MAATYYTLCNERLGPRLVEMMGEAIIYTPSGSAALTINAVVTRNGLQTRSEDGGARLEYPVEILVAHADVSSVKVQADTVALRRRKDDSENTTMRVAALLSSEGALWRLGLA